MIPGEHEEACLDTGSAQHAESVAPPEGRFPVIYADPPWGWSQSKLTDRGSARTVEKEYGTMKAPRAGNAEEIEALPVGDWAADDATLFLWVTGPKLIHGLSVLKAWGFTFKTIGFCWVKRNRKTPSLFWGMGFYTRANVELCLIGTKGKGLPRKDAGVHQVVEAPIDKHSRKPAEVRARIERLYDGPYLELFARERPVGWSVWGDEAEVALFPEQCPGCGGHVVCDCVPALIDGSEGA